MHFAVGMGCAGAATGVICSVWRRGWRWIPATMTLGGIWALVPDLPRVFREDIYWKPLSQLVGTRDVERFLHAWGDLFCFHRQLDLQPREHALLGLTIILLLYNLSILVLMRLEHQHRNSLANRAWRAHRCRQARKARRRRLQRAQPPTLVRPVEGDPAVIYRIRPDNPLSVRDYPPA